ncbi:MAG: dTDP-4-dehydrorhamnose reductase [Acidobacteriota bacterium]|nr:dTDP-4-dehydrorhamnose reductase [Acidobacteriota bacterium]MDQ5873334.1 dTDP-4-dehydrorhamnose reductase [Acidobacteriota bacterium]
MLITGGSGMLACDLAPELAGAGYEIYPRPRADLDVTDPLAVARAFRDVRPQIVVNCAAFTRVDACESDPRARAVNAEAVETLAAQCEVHGARLVQISTDFVFDGAKGEPYLETDVPGPLSAYGREKRAGEQAALRLPTSLVVRASWLFGRGGWNFIEAILKQAEQGKRELTVVDDQRGRPTATTDLSEAIRSLLAAGATGIFHFANRGAVTWFEFAVEILNAAGRSDVRVAPTASAALARPAVRPLYSVLDTTKYESSTGRTIRNFREPLVEYLAGRLRSEA